MSRSPPQPDSRQFGLEFGQILGRHFLGTEDLHFGLWPADLPVCWGNVSAAQAHHSQMILDHIPEGVRSILDVGGGAGHFARKLRDCGYAVDMVSPSAHLRTRARELLGPESTVIVSRLEELQTDQRYDLVLFSESFQYIPVAQALSCAEGLLADEGKLLILDDFRRKVPGRPPVGGGHRWEQWELGLANSPFEMLHEVGVTALAAPMCQLFGELMDEVGVPLRDLVVDYGTTQRPFVAKILGWLFRRKIDKVNRRHFSGRINRDAFIEQIIYKLMLLQPTITSSKNS
ncbi:MAG: SAM-dependent methyltransferase [Pseudohongiellaceae bacterium]|jgi:SAM-dependent methyltransferase